MTSSNAGHLIDRLEPRRLMAATFSQNRRTLLVTTDDVATTVELSVTTDERNLVLRVDGVEVGRFRRGKPDVGDDRRRVRKVRVECGAGNDVVRMFAAADDPATADVDETAFIDLPVTVVGGAGDDVLVGDKRADTIIGGAGNDVIDASFGNDVILGGTGADMLAGGDGRDLIFGQDDDDRLDGGNERDALYGLRGDDTYLPGGGAERDIVRLSGPGDVVVGPVGDARIDGGDIEMFNDYADRFISLGIPKRYRDEARS